MATADGDGRGADPAGRMTRAWVATLCLAGLPLLLQVPALVALLKVMP